MTADDFVRSEIQLHIAWLKTIKNTKEDKTADEWFKEFEEWCGYLMGNYHEI